MSTKKLQILGVLPKTADDLEAVSYGAAQELTDKQKAQARANIGIDETGNGTSVSEVEISDTAPTDENVEIWVNMSEEPVGVAIYSTNSSGSTTSVQSDWNQNDETAPDYIKNKPFGEEETLVEVFKLENATFTLPDESIPCSMYQSEATFEIEADKTYVVNWDGTEYTCTSTFVDGANAFGNLSAMGIGAGNGEPFIFGYVSAQNMFFIYDLNKETSHTISVSEIVTEIKKIDEKYLPDNISLPEGYPVKNNIVIEWDGDTTDKVSIADVYYKVSDLILTDDEIKSGIITRVVDGETESIELSSCWDEEMSNGGITEDFAAFNKAVVFVRNSGANLEGITLEETGVFFIKRQISENLYTTTRFETTTTTTMSPSLLPPEAMMQSDLSQTDETSVDFVKGTLRNEHLPEGYPYKEIVDEIAYEGVDVPFNGSSSYLNGNEVYYHDPFEFEIIVGETYIVTWDDVEYNLIARYDDEYTDWPTLGSNYNSITEDMPFNIYQASNQEYPECRTISTASTHNITIIHKKNVTHTINEEFIPDSIKHNSGSWNDLTDKPFSYEDLGVDAMTITWNGNPEGYETTQFGTNMYFCKVSDVILPLESFDGGTITTVLDGSTATINLSIVQGNVQDGSSMGMPLVAAGDLERQLFVYAIQEDATMNGANLTAGVHFLYGTDDTGAIIGYVSELRTVDAFRLVQIEEQFMPDTVKKTVDIVESTEFEEWSFELEDGSTVTKKVVVQS